MIDTLAPPTISKFIDHQAALQCPAAEFTELLSLLHRTVNSCAVLHAISLINDAATDSRRFFRDTRHRKTLRWYSIIKS